MTVKELKEAISHLPDETPVVFQGNIKGEEDSEDAEDATYTTCVGNCFSAFWRTNMDLSELVLDCAITDSEC